MFVYHWECVDQRASVYIGLLVCCIFCCNLFCHISIRVVSCIYFIRKQIQLMRPRLYINNINHICSTNDCSENIQSPSLTTCVIGFSIKSQAWTRGIKELSIKGPPQKHFLCVHNKNTVSLFDFFFYSV